MSQTILDTITISRSDLTNIHALLADGLLVDPRHGRAAAAAARRHHSLPTTGRSVISLPSRTSSPFSSTRAAAINDPFEQSFFLLVHIPYLQAFDDLNKRTSRVASNIPLLKEDLAPMSFLTMHDRDYVDGLIGSTS